MAVELASKSRIVFACGRYEGIDQRVVEHYSKIADTREVSIGDYVLNGGEVAAVVMIEAIARLVPGVIGNAESLSEESHNEGLLEYPSYTKPASWRELEVPEVLLSGNHAEIAKWRRGQQLERTKTNRPDLL
jgi:tRNA (guanine37-N1)-methyltransferase